MRKIFLLLPILFMFGCASTGQIMNRGGGEFTIISQGSSERAAVDTALRTAERARRRKGYSEFIVKEKKVEYTGIFRNEQQQRRASTALGVAGVILSARGDHASADEAQASRDELTRDSFRCELIVIFQ